MRDDRMQGDQVMDALVLQPNHPVIVSWTVTGLTQKGFNTLDARRETDWF